MKIKGLFLIVVLALATGCNPPEDIAMAKDESKTLKSWFEGNFIFSDGGAGIYFENWRKTDTSTYEGYGNYVTNDLIDTLFRMNMKLVINKHKATMFYDVTERSKKKQLEFALTSKENSTYVFENPFHDFPSIMQYKVMADSSIEVTERGFINNKERVREFTLKRTN